MPCHGHHERMQHREHAPHRLPTCLWFCCVHGIALARSDIFLCGAGGTTRLLLIRCLIGAALALLMISTIGHLNAPLLYVAPGSSK